MVLMSSTSSDRQIDRQTDRQTGNAPVSVETDFLSELGLEKGEDEQNSWDSEVNTHSHPRSGTSSAFRQSWF